MTWTLFGEYIDILLTFVLVIRVLGFSLQTKYLACLVFLVLDSLGSLVYVVDKALDNRGINLIDYRIIWFFDELVLWVGTVWMMYALLIAILKHLPGILTISLKVLNFIFVICLGLALMTLRSEYAAAQAPSAKSALRQLSILTGEITRAVSLAELLSILCVLAFVLWFPIQVPKNLAAFSAGLSIYLLLTTVFLLTRTYLPAFFNLPGVRSIPSFYLAFCVVYWIFVVTPAGEEVEVTLGRARRTVPPEHLVRQLDAINTALLRSKEHA